MIAFGEPTHARASTSHQPSLVTAQKRLSQGVMIRAWKDRSVGRAKALPALPRTRLKGADYRGSDRDPTLFLPGHHGAVGVIS